MLNLLPKGAQTKLVKFFFLKIFSICHRFRWHRWCTSSREYLREFSKKFEMAVIVYSHAWGKLIHEKNQKSKISWHCPFKSQIFLQKTVAICQMTFFPRVDETLNFSKNIFIMIGQTKQLVYLDCPTNAFAQVVSEIQDGSANKIKCLIISSQGLSFTHFPLGFVCVEENLLRKGFFPRYDFFFVQVYWGSGGAATRQVVPFQSFKQVTKHKLT